MYEKELQIPAEHKLVQTNTELKQKRGEDIDTYWYDEFDKDNKLIAKYIVYDITSMHPPFVNTVRFDKEDVSNV